MWSSGFGVREREAREGRERKIVMSLPKRLSGERKLILTNSNHVIHGVFMVSKCEIKM